MIFSFILTRIHISITCNTTINHRAPLTNYIVGLLATLPTILMSYATAPFVKQVALQIPMWATTSREQLLRFVTHMPPETKLEFTTLRAFPLERKTAVYFHELRACEKKWGRFANVRISSASTSTFTFPFPFSLSYIVRLLCLLNTPSRETACSSLL